MISPMIFLDAMDLWNCCQLPRFRDSKNFCQLPRCNGLLNLLWFCSQTRGSKSFTPYEALSKPWLCQFHIRCAVFNRKSNEICEQKRMMGMGGRKIFVVNIIKRFARKLCWIILFYLGLTTCRTLFGKNRQSSFLWFSDLADVTMISKTNDSPNPFLLIWLRHQDILKGPRKSNII